jgi:hypothetical protein
MNDQSDWLNRANYTAEQRRHMCVQLLSEAQYWDVHQYLKMMHDSTKRPWVGLTDEEVTEVYMAVEEEVNEHWNKGGTTMMFPPALYKAIEAKLKEKM